MKVKHILIALLLLLVLAALMFGYLYQTGKRPFDKADLLSTEDQPRFLYSIYKGKNKLSHPMGVTVNGSGKIFVSNNGIHTIEVITQSGRNNGAFGGEGKLPGQLLYPYGIGILPDGRMLLTETGNSRIQVFNADGRFMQTLIGEKSSSGLGKPGPIFVDSKGNIFVGDLAGAQVLVFNINGTVIRKIPNVSYPHGIAVDEQNRKLYVSDAGQGCVKVFALDGGKNSPVKVIKEFVPGTTFSNVRGLAVDKQGRLYVVDSLVGAVRVFDSGGKYLFSFGGQGFGDGEFLYPNQIFADSDGKIFIADWGNNRVQVWGY